MEDYKAILNQDGTASLYNLKDDPLEMRDVSGDPKHADALGKARGYHNEYVDRIALHPKLRSFG